MKKRIPFFLSTCLILSIAASSAFAQINLFQNQEEEDVGPPKAFNPYDDKYKPNLKIEGSDDKSLVPNYIFFATFLRKPDASPDDLNLYILSPGSVFGCLDIENPELEPVQIGTALHLRLTDGHIGADSETVRYFHHECKPGPGQSEVFLTLSKKQLIQDGIEKLVLVSKKIGPFNDITLDFADDRVTVTSKMQDLTLFGLPVKGQTTQLTYWNYPENTMVLTSSSVNLGDEKIKRAVKSMARRKGLTPLDEIIPDFVPHHTNADKLYVVDISGRFDDRLEEPDDVFILGTLETKELYFGVDGPYKKTIPRTIFAKRPGIYE